MTPGDKISLVSEYLSSPPLRRDMPSAVEGLGKGIRSISLYLMSKTREQADSAPANQERGFGAWTGKTGSIRNRVIRNFGGIISPGGPTQAVALSVLITKLGAPSMTLHLRHGWET